MATATIVKSPESVKITAVSGAVPVGARIPTGGTTGQTLTKASGDNYDTEWATPSGSGDMVAATYDPNSVEDDAFDMANMVEATDAKIMTAAERAAITANTAKETNATHTGDVTGSGALTIADGAVTAAKTHADVQASLALADSAIQSGDLATVATTGDYDDLSNKPTIPTVSDAAYGAGWNGDTDAPSKNAVYDKIEAISAGAPEGTAVLSTGETGGTKFLREDGDGSCSWQTIAGGGDALVANPLSQFAATTSAQLAGVMSDETGSGALVFGTSPTITTPTISGNLTTDGLIDGRDIDADGTKLDGIEASADVTDETNVVAALDGATLTAVTVAGTDKVIVQDASDSDNIKTVTAQSIADLASTGVDTSGTPVANDFARFTDADTIEGRSYAEVRADLGLEIGTDVQAYDADTAKTDVAQEFTALQTCDVEVLSDGATVTPTGALSLHTLTLGGNRTLANPTTITAGATYVFKITQDGTGSRTLSWGAAYDWAGGTAPTLSTGAGDVDVFSGISLDGTSIQMVTAGQDYS